MDYSGGITLPKISCLLSLPPWITQLCTSPSYSGVDAALEGIHRRINKSTEQSLSMATAAVAPQPNGVGPPLDPVQREAWEISQYEKIMEIRDQVFAGTHPRLKLLFPVDPKTGEKLTVHSQPPSNSYESGSITQPVPSLSASAKSSHLPQLPPPSAQLQAPSNASPAVAGASGIDPIFLTKSDVLLRAETQQKRQRIERVLADQVKEKQASSKQRASDQDDLPDFNVTEVLRKAQELVTPVKFADISGANGNASASDSFDENTFYSSQMNDSTPETTDKAEPSRKQLTQNCKFFLRGEKCPYGEQCIYAHNPAMRPPYGQKSQAQVVDTDADLQAPSGARNTAQQDASNRGPATETLSDAERIAQLEAQLRELKSQKHEKIAGPSQINTRNAQEAQEEEPIYSPPDAVLPPKSNVNTSSRRKDAGQQQQRGTLAQTEASGREYPRQEVHSHESAVRSPIVREGRVVRNHITSPVAPQPARVSPLAVAKAPPISQGQRQQRRINDPFRESGTGITAAQSSQFPNQASNPRKRKKARESGESIRNVMPRREPLSPDIRVKEEPISPPPFTEPTERWESRRQQEDRGPVYIDDVSPRYQDQRAVVYRPNVIDRPAPRYVLDDYHEPPAPRHEPDLRRVVGTRQIRPPLADTERFSSPQPPPTRSASQVYIPRQDQEIPRQYRTSTQPEAIPYVERDRATSPEYREAPLVMAPPPRRIVVDQHGNQFYEREVAPMPRPRQSSMVPLPRQGAPDRTFHSPAPRHSVARIPQPIDDGSELRYTRRGPSPPSPKYIEYVSPTQARPPMNQDMDMIYSNDSQPLRSDGVRLVEYPPPHANGRYEDLRPIEGITRVSSVRPVGHHFEAGLERVSRVQSVHPESRRVVTYGGEMIQQGSRHMSIRPEEAYSRPIEYAPTRFQYYPGPDGRG